MQITIIMYILKKIYINIRRLNSIIAVKKAVLINFILPNARKIAKKRIKFRTVPICSQYVICEGDGLVEIGENCMFGFKLCGFNRWGSIELQARYINAVIKIGKNVRTNNNIMICAANKIIIGDNTLIGQYVTIMDHDGHGISPGSRNEIGEIGSVQLGSNLWIGNNVTILKNSVIGDNTVVATGSVVSGYFPSNVVIGGVPAKVIKDLL